MTARRVGMGVFVCAVVLLALTLGVRWLTTGGSAIPSPNATSVPIFAGESPAPTANRSKVGLPNPDLTPGAINPAATQDNLDSTVCKTGWAKSVRPPSAFTSALKVAQIVQYGYSDRAPSHYQEDHLVPLELGGAPRDHRNLWPEPNTATQEDGTTIESKQKDALEDVLHARVCAGTMALAEAQLSIARDWIAAWVAAGRP